jgi:DNA-binding MarR family transcriptional regulator
MADNSQLSVNDRVLLHLYRFASDVAPEEYPPDTTQAGIASAIGISRTHVPRAVKVLMKDGMAEELRGRVEGHERRMSVYALTPEGVRRADELWNATLSSKLPVSSAGKTSSMDGKEIEELLGKRKAIAAISGMRDGVVEIDSRRRKAIRELQLAPKAREFFGREPELKVMDNFMESESRILVVLGNRGYGTSMLARKFVDEQDDADVFWVTLIPEPSVGELEGRLTAFASKIKGEPATLSDAVNLPSAIVVFDDYFSPSDEIVEFFSALVEVKGDTKMLITAREETPAYNWFYHKRDIDSGVVSELRIRGLDTDSAKLMLGNEDIEADALRRICMITKGQPMVLRMLRDGDMEGLKQNSVFTAEEIRYLLFLKDKKQ